jgi:hypothetical protein
MVSSPRAASTEGSRIGLSPNAASEPYLRASRTASTGRDSRTPLSSWLPRPSYEILHPSTSDVHGITWGERARTVTPFGVST